MLNFSQTQEQDVEQIDTNEDDDFLDMESLDYQASLDWLDAVDDTTDSMEYINMFLAGNFDEEQVAELLPESTLDALSQLYQQCDGDTDAMMKVLLDSNLVPLFDNVDGSTDEALQISQEMSVVGAIGGSAALFAIAIVINKIVNSNKFWANRIKSKLPLIKDTKINTVKMQSLADYDEMFTALTTATTIRKMLTKISDSFTTVKPDDLNKLIDLSSKMIQAKNSVKSDRFNDLMKAIAWLGVFSAAGLNPSGVGIFIGGLAAQQVHRSYQGRNIPLALRGWKSVREYQTVGKLLLDELAATEKLHKSVKALIVHLKQYGTLTPVQKTGLKALAKICRFYTSFIFMHKQSFYHAIRKLSR